MTASVNPLYRFWNLLRLYRPRIYQIYTYAILNGLVNLSLPLGIQAIINLIQGGQMSTSWTILVGVVLVGIAITGTLQVLQLRIVEDIQQDIFARSSLEFATRLPKIKLLELDTIHAPELANRFFDTLTIQKGLPKILIDFSLAAFQVIFGLILLTIYSPYFIILGVSLFFLLYLIYFLTAAKGLNTSLLESKYKYKSAHWLEEIGRTNKSFKLNSDSNFHLYKSDAITTDYLQARENHFNILLQQFRYFIGFKVFLAAGLLILGSYLVFQQQMNIGQFVAAEIIIILMINSVEKIIRSVDTIYDVLTALDKIGYVTDLPLDIEKGMQISPAKSGLTVEAVDLEFKFPDAQQPLFKDLSFKIPAGEKVYITGKSGSGKSTLLHLVAGLFPFAEGQVLINEIPIRNLNKDQLYADIGFYLPTNQLFEATILENITLGRDFSDEEVFELIERLSLKSFIAHQPEGIHALIDPEGRRLPRSIIRKILIARILINQPRLLLLEDPVQFLPNSEKQQIIDYIMDSSRPWTVLVVGDYDYWKQKSTQVIEL